MASDREVYRVFSCIFCIVKDFDNTENYHVVYLFTYRLYRAMHWRRQLWGTEARAPLDFQLVILGITRFTDSDESHTHGFLSSRTIANKFQLHTYFRFR